MATLHSHRPATPGHVSLDLRRPGSLLTGDELAPLRDLHSAYLAAQARVEAAHEALHEAKDAKAIRDSAIRQAVLTGMKVPAAISEAEAAAISEAATRSLNAALQAAHKAATAYETAVLSHRDAVRSALVPEFEHIDAETNAAERLAAEKRVERAQVLAALDSLDAAAVEADTKASGERTVRFRSALIQARERLGETATVQVDLLRSEEYDLARMGEMTATLVRDLTAQLAAIRNGDKKFLSFADRANAESRVLEALAAARRL